MPGDMPIKKYIERQYVPKSKIKEYRDMLIEESKEEESFMTHSSQINACLISLCNELLKGGQIK